MDFWGFILHRQWQSAWDTKWCCKLTHLPWRQPYPSDTEGQSHELEVKQSHTSLPTYVALVNRPSSTTPITSGCVPWSIGQIFFSISVKPKTFRSLIVKGQSSTHDWMVHLKHSIDQKQKTKQDIDSRFLFLDPNSGSFLDGFQLFLYTSQTFTWRVYHMINTCLASTYSRACNGYAYFQILGYKC